jgi:magnesium transporter
VPLTCRLYRNGVVAEKDVDPARISDLLEEEGSLVWVDVEDPSDAEMRTLAEELSLHPLAVEDTQHRDQRPKVEIYKDHFFLVLHALSVDGEEMRDSEIHAFAGPGYLVTLRYSPAFDIGPVRQRWERQPELAAEGGGFLLYALLDEVVDDYFGVIERFEGVSEDIEEAVFSDEPVPDLQERIFRLKKQVLQFRRRVMPLREVLDLLQEGMGFVTERLRPYYRDVADHTIRVLEFTDNVRELLTTALEAHLSQVSNRLNQVVKAVTSWGAIILVPSLITGIYGMNFRHMPELHWVLGYPMALALMALSAFALHRVFRRRDWI